MRILIEQPAAHDALGAGAVVWIEGLGAVTVHRLVPHGRQHRIEVDRVRRVERAKGLVHAEVWVPERALAGHDAAVGGDRSATSSDAGTSDSAAHDDPWRWVGRPVLHDGRKIGVVQAVDGPELHPLLRIRTPVGEHLIPAIAPYVQAHPNAVHLVDPPVGLLETS